MTTLRTFFCALLVAWLLQFSAFAQTLSGSYVGGGDNFTVVLQMLPAGDGKLLGRLRSFGIDSKGKITSFDSPFSGAANSNSFVGKLETGWAAGGDVAISGSLKDGNLMVSSANGLKVSLRKGDEVDFNRSVEVLKRLSQGIQQRDTRLALAAQNTREAANIAWQISVLRGKISDFASQKPLEVNAYATEAQKYLVITQKMKEAREQLAIVTAQTGDAEGRRSSLSSRIYHLAIEASHVHIDVKNAQRSFETDADRLLIGTSAAEKACQKGVPEGVEDKSLLIECTKLPASKLSLNNMFGQVTEKYAVLEKIWLAEKTEQERIHRSSEEFVQQHSIRR